MEAAVDIITRTTITTTASTEDQAGTIQAVKATTIETTTEAVVVITTMAREAPEEALVAMVAATTITIIEEMGETIRSAIGGLTTAVTKEAPLKTAWATATTHGSTTVIKTKIRITIAVYNNLQTTTLTNNKNNDDSSSISINQSTTIRALIITTVAIRTIAMVEMECNDQTTVDLHLSSQQRLNSTIHLLTIRPIRNSSLSSQMPNDFNSTEQFAN